MGSNSSKSLLWGKRVRGLRGFSRIGNFSRSFPALVNIGSKLSFSNLAQQGTDPFFLFVIFGIRDPKQSQPLWS